MVILPPFLDAAPILVHGAPAGGRAAGDRGDDAAGRQARQLQDACGSTRQNPRYALVPLHHRRRPGPARCRGAVRRFPAGKNRLAWAEGAKRGRRPAVGLQAPCLARLWRSLWAGLSRGQAAGLPVVAQAIAGVPSVVVHDRTGILTPAGDVAAFAAAIRDLLSNERERTRLAAGARAFAANERTLEAGSRRLMAIVHEFAEIEQ